MKEVKNVLEKETSNRGTVKAKGGEAARTERYVSATGKLLNDREEAESRMAMDS